LTTTRDSGAGGSFGRNALSLLNQQAGTPLRGADGLHSIKSIALYAAASEPEVPQLYEGCQNAYIEC